ncbi:S9 family peptidase [Antarcticibacterium flavum]|uniref:S9 family peptidase n=1 Tax=Antarcticibacterium flavum TaxID=2058175 RepID=A0A5B7X117_9FLAO|nr:MULTISPECIES: prolyl oligopeptidase family serine peptidase [Antarcticibacterium]MCM4160707.1 S9 family peptidase [Antarcticibacterium sp. W02-3]QCY68815.1 S9 family peptidase [Antarcticibacterium flavum]
MQTVFKKFTPLFFLFLGCQVIFSQESSLTVEQIMQDPQWMGTFPSNIHWAEDSKTIFFNYNLQKDPADSLYKINLNAQDQILKVPYEEEKKEISRAGDYNKKRDKKVFVKDDALMLYDLKTHNSKKLLELDGRIGNPKFLGDENKISFNLRDNIFVYDQQTGSLKKLTNISSGEKKKEAAGLGAKDDWVKTENLGLLEVVREREDKKEASKTYRTQTQGEPFTFYAGKRSVSNLQLSPDASYATFTLITRPESKSTDVPNYVDASGYTVNLPARSKVGDDPTKVEMAIYDIKRDTVYMVQTGNLPGIQDLPDYTSSYPDREWEKKDRDLILAGPYFSDNGKQTVVNVRSQDNKDRWIALLDLQTGALKNLDRQRDEAWIAGPGIGWSFSGGTFGWLPDNRHIYFQSEVSGYSHLYLLDVNSGDKKALTSGNYEVFDPFLSRDKKHWYLTTSEVGPGERHFYKMPVMGGKMEKLTQMTGNNDVSLSPDEKYMAILYSYSNKPWELYLKRTTAGAEAKQLTSGQSEEFKSYDWREPELVQFQAEDGVMVPARLYKPENANGAAVIFVHGAGYLQNVHKWWSSYFREYMFHNLLTDLGYTVLDIDYRGSAGYGRDWRTGIYRHMGGKDLSDQVDGAKYLVAEHGVDAENVGIYGGSYGGFITLMALFTEAETFKSGAALRSVTDWAHYNHGYTSNILNNPSDDPIAYRQSSPIYFAEGLEGHLLIAHGMLDVNVHFQDVVRLAQRLIELKKDNWEMAVYPVEDHGFVEPSSWTDEYKRILKLFNETLLEKERNTEMERVKS